MIQAELESGELRGSHQETGADLDARAVQGTL